MCQNLDGNDFLTRKKCLAAHSILIHSKSQTFLMPFVAGFSSCSCSCFKVASFIVFYKLSLSLSLFLLGIVHSVIQYATPILPGISTLQFPHRSVCEGGKKAFAELQQTVSMSGTDRYIPRHITIYLCCCAAVCMVRVLTDGQVPLKHTLGVNVEGQTLERPRDLEVEIFPIKRAERDTQHVRTCNMAQGFCTLTFRKAAVMSAETVCLSVGT